jgi:hypothetical protein
MTVGYKDEVAADQVAIIERGKDIVRVTLPIVGTRSGKSVSTRRRGSPRGDRSRGPDDWIEGLPVACAGPQSLWAWNIVRWPLAFALVVSAIGCIDHFAPDTTHEWIWITPGSMTAATLWLLVSLAFRMYVSHFADYQKTYGAIGGVMVALLWCYLTSLAILIGAQLDATIERASTTAASRESL